MYPSPQDDFDAWSEATHADGMMNGYGDLNALVPLAPGGALRQRLDAERKLFGLHIVKLSEVSEELRGDEDEMTVDLLPRTSEDWLRAFEGWLQARKQDVSVPEQGDPRVLQSSPELAPLWLEYLRQEPLRESIWRLWCYLTP